MVEWWKIVVTILCIFLSGAFSGLTLGLLSLDLVDLRVLLESGTPREIKYAKRILPVRKRGNWLLCTLLIGNTAVNSALAIVTSDLFGGIAGFLSSTLIILYIGEIIPQSVCFKYGLFVGAHTIPFVRLAMFLTFPLAYPTSRVLDWALGGEQVTRYNKSQLKSLVNLHGEHVVDGVVMGGSDSVNGGSIPDGDVRSDDAGGGEDRDVPEPQGKAKKRGRKAAKTGGLLTLDETTILRGALDFAAKSVRDVMTPLKKVVMLDSSQRLSFKTLMAVFHSGHSRIPVYEGERENIVGMLFAKDLILLDPDDNVPIKTVLEFFNREVRYVAASTLLDRMLRDFKSSRSHLAVVRDGVGEGVRGFVPPTVGQTVGVLALEDVLEELVGEIVDETDVFADNVSTQVIRRRHVDKDVLRLLHHGAGAVAEEHLSAKEALVVASYLAHNTLEFSSRFVTDRVLRSLLADAPMLTLTDPREEDGGDSTLPRSGSGGGGSGGGGGAEHGGEAYHVVDFTAGAEGEHAPMPAPGTGRLLYKRGVATKDALLIINGTMEIVAGSEAFMSEAGPWTLLAAHALTDDLYAPDFSARITEYPLRALRLPRKLYKAMLRLSGTASGGSAAALEGGAVLPIKHVSPHTLQPVGSKGALMAASSVPVTEAVAEAGAAPTHSLAAGSDGGGVGGTPVGSMPGSPRGGPPPGAPGGPPSGSLAPPYGGRIRGRRRPSLDVPLLRASDSDFSDSDADTPPGATPVPPAASGDGGRAAGENPEGGAVGTLPAWQPPV